TTPLVDASTSPTRLTSWNSPPSTSACPRPNGFTPQFLQKKWTIELRPNRYSESASFPCTNRKAPCLAIAFQNRVLPQMEQLHRLVPWASARSHSKRTDPQWQRPL